MTVATNNDRFIHVESSEYPLYLYQIPKHNPQLSLPVDVTLEALFNAGYALVNPVDAPAGDVVTEGVPEKVGEEYFQTWVVRDFTPEEAAQNFANKKADVLSSAGVLFNNALETGAAVEIAGVEGVQHFGLSEVQRTDYAAMKARATRTGATTLLTLRSKEGVSVKLVPARMIVLCEALEDSFYDIQLAHYDLIDLIEAAENISELPTLPEVIAPEQRVVA